jgi:hypothetical protein
MQDDSSPELTFDDWQRAKQSSRRRIYEAVGLLTGFVAGGWLALRLLFFVGVQLAGRDFLQIGWLFVLFVVPSGACFGAKVGWLFGHEKPVLIWLLFVPLASIAIGYEIQIHRLRRVDRPRDYEFEVRTISRPLLNAKPSTDRTVRGWIVTDGVQKDLEGKTPTRFTTHGRRISFQFELVDAEPGEWFEVELSSEGRKGGDFESDRKINGRAFAIGEGELLRWDISTGVENRDMAKP